MSPAHHISPEKKVQALRLRDEGLSMSEIVRKTGMCRSTLAVLFRRAKKLNIDGETSATGPDVASVFPSELFLESAGQPRVKMNEYMTHKVWKEMEEDENVSARYLVEALPCLAGVSHRKVQLVMTNLRKAKKNGQPPPRPPKRLLFKETPLLALKKWSQKRCEDYYDTPELREIMDLLQEVLESPAAERQAIGQWIKAEMPREMVRSIDRFNNRR